jgi:hypothetical protein
MAITSTIYRPYKWSPVYNDIIFQVQSDKTNQYDFKYVFDVIVDGGNIARYESRPLPDGTGLINVSNVLKGYIDNTTGWIEQIHTITGSSIMEAIRSDGKVGYLSVRAGEVYRATQFSPIVLYNGFGTQSGNPSYSLFAQLDGQVIRSGNNNINFYNGYKTPDKFYQFIGDPNTQDYKYVMNFTASSPKGLFLSEVPGTFNNRNIFLQRGDKCSLTFWNDMRQKYDVNDPQQVWGWRFQFFNSANSLLNTTNVNNVYSSVNTLGLIGTFSDGYSSTFTSSYAIGQIACGPADPKVREVLAAQPTTAYYTLQLNAPLEPITLPNVFNPVSEKITFTLETPGGLDYSRWRFSWLNSLGGRDWFNFVKKNTEVYNQTRQVFYKQPRYMSGGSFGSNLIEPSEYGDTTYNMTIDQKFQATTDWITEEYSVYLKGLFNSPHILAYPPTEVGNPDIPRLVVIDTTSYEVMDYNRAKVFNYTIDFHFSQPINTQY